MELVDGKTVYEELAKRIRYAEQEALQIIIQMARALEHAHARGFIHRDVKPKNIMITREGVAKLADMGLTREAGDAAAAAAEKGRAYGTPYYISPEQIRGVEDVDFRADIYSLGATLYHMVTGRVPFEGSTPAEIMQKHLREPLVPPDHINADLSAGLAEVVERAMARDRRQRYQSTTDLLLDLERVQRGEAPLQARSRYSSKLLTDLASGNASGQGDGGYGSQATNGMQHSPTGMPSYVAALIAMLIVESVAIVVLIVLLVTR
jgi:serine/threonine-protein kinase